MQNFPVIPKEERLLAYSGFLNLLLFGLCAWLFLREPAPVAAPDADVDFPPFVSPPPQAVADAKSMRWSQLESTDYSVYMANLRAFGCPPETIRDIILGDVESLFAQKEKDVQDQAAAAGATAALPEKLAALRQEELQLIAQLLGPQAEAYVAALHAGSDTAPSSAEPQTAQTVQQPAVPLNAVALAKLQQPAAIPLALVSPDPSLQLSEDQADRLETLRKAFVDAVGGPNQNPNDPQYLIRWRKAQADADDQLRTYFGQDLYYKFQLQAQHSSAGPGVQ